MYLEHFGLAEPPFRITPHTEFFFAGAKRGAFLEALLYAVDRDEGIIKVSGEVGAGKTMLARMLLERLPAGTRGIYLADPLLGREALLHTLADELEIPEGERPPHRLLRCVQERLVALYAEGRRTVLLVDEAHAMPAESLEEIRLLSNLEAERHKLLQIVLLGQPELDQALARPAMRQLKDRITQHFRLPPFAPDEVGDYVAHRLHAAGYRGAPVFTAAALARIARRSGGLTRRINVLADKALLAAFAAGRHVVGKNEVRQAARDAEIGPPRRFPWPWLAAPALAALVAAWQVVPWPQAASAAREIPPAPHTTAVVSPPAAVASPPPSPPISPLQPVPPPPAEPVHADVAYGPHTRARLEATLPWLRQSGEDRWMVQIASVDATRPRYIESLVDQLTAASGSQPVHVLEGGPSGARQVVLLFGDFADRAAAGRALTQLPTALRAFQPYPRTVRALRGR